MANRILVLLIGNIRYDGRVKKEISSLQKFGYEVSLVVTSFDADDSKSNYNFPIYKVDQPSGTNPVNKVINKRKYTRQIDGIIREVKPDFLHCNDSTIFYVSKWIKKIKVIYDAHELLPEMEYGIRKTITTYLERKKLKNVYKVILPQIDRLNLFYFMNKDLIKRNQLYLLENFPSKNNNVSSNYFANKFGFTTNKKIISYVGVVNKERKILEIVKAVAKIENLVFFIFGPSPPEYNMKIQHIIKTLRLENRIFLNGPIPNEEVINVSESSDIGVCFYTDPNLNSYFCASNKLYENLNSGMVVLSNNIAGTARVIKNGINGYLINEINDIEISKALKALSVIPRPGRSSFYWENQESILKEIYV